MIRTTLTALAATLVLGGAAVAQQSDQSTDAKSEAEVGAPASAQTGVKGVYSMKNMMGLSTGGSEKSDDANAKTDEESSKTSGSN